MKKNMGAADRITRLVIAAIIAFLYFTNVITGTLGIVLVIIAAVFVATSLISFCPLYTILGINSCKTKTN
jgi:hypothetical protein